MSGDRGFKRCPVCDKDKPTTRTGVMGKHNRWDGKKMVPCRGFLKFPKPPEGGSK